MKPARSVFGIAAAALAAVLASGCYESPEVAMHEPGVYKGKPDSDAIMRPSAEAREALKERLRLTQSDR